MISFFVLTFLLQRPCLYCSALLLVLFCSSCSWASSCFFDFGGNWLETRLFPSLLPSSPPTFLASPGGLQTNQGIAGEGYVGDASFLVAAFNETTATLAKAAAEGMKAKVLGKQDWSSVGMTWLKGLLGREFRLPCINVQVRL